MVNTDWRMVTAAGRPEIWGTRLSGVWHWPPRWVHIHSAGRWAFLLLSRRPHQAARTDMVSDSTDVPLP